MRFEEEQSKKFKAMFYVPGNASEYEYGAFSFKDGRRYLIPLHSKAIAVRALDLYNAQTPGARIAKRLLSGGLRIGVAQYFLKNGYLDTLSQTVQGGEVDGRLLEHLKHVLDQDELRFAISFGKPGPHNKPVVQALIPNGAVVCYVKLAWNEETNALVQNEAKHLDRLAQTSFDSFVTPTVVYTGWWNDSFFFAQSPLESRGSSSPRTLIPLHLAVQRELFAFHKRWLPLQESAFWRDLLRLVVRTQASTCSELLTKGVSKAAEWFGDRRFPFHLRHGDFTPWNAHLLHGRLCLYDWEYAASESPAGYDLFHFSMQTSMRLQHRSAREAYVAFKQRDETAWRIVEHLVSLGLNEQDEYPLFFLYCLERLAFYAADSAADQQALHYFTSLIDVLLQEDTFEQ